MNTVVEDEEIERGWSGPTDVPFPKNRAAFERRSIRDSIANLTRYANVERQSSSTNLDKLILIEEHSIAEIVCEGRSISAEKKSIVATLMRAMAKYAKASPLAVNSMNDFSEPDGVLIANVSRLAGVSEADAAAVPLPIVRRMRSLI